MSLKNGTLAANKKKMARFKSSTSPQNNNNCLIHSVKVNYMIIENRKDQHEKTTHIIGYSCKSQHNCIR